MNPIFSSLSARRMQVLSAVALACLSSLPALAVPVVQNFSYTTAWGEAPTLNQTFDVARWGSLPEYNGDSSLTGVTIALTAELRYEGTLISVLASQSYTLQAASDFTFNLNGNPLATNLDPLVTQSGVSPGTALTPFSVPGSGQLTDADSASLAQAVGTFLGTGIIPLQVTGSLLATGPGGYHNLTDTGPASPFVFLNNTKVFSMEQMQLFQLHTTVIVTYAVPEASTWAAVATLGGGALACWRRQRRAGSSRNGRQT